MSNLADIRNRITEVRKMRLGDVAHNPQNWRGHPSGQRQAFQGVVREIGWAGMPLVYHSERTGALTYVDGHMRKEELPDLEADVAITDLDDAEADLLLVAYDPLAAMAEANREKLGALLQDVQSDETGVQAMLSNLSRREKLFLDENGQEIDPWAEWKGMPEFEQEDLSAYQSIHVHFKNRADVETFAQLIGQTLTEKTRVIWYPEAKKIDMVSEYYSDES